jgi:hypothetical protein
MDAAAIEPEPGEPADIHVQDSWGLVIGDHARVTNNFSGPGRVAGSAYLEQVREITPADLRGREAELSDLAAFCAGDSSYTWWQAGPGLGSRPSCRGSCCILRPASTLLHSSSRPG